jgi:hypothetical protein
LSYSHHSLSTSSGDKTSVAAIEKYYKTVSMACSPQSPAKAFDVTDVEKENPLGTFDDDDTSDQEYMDELAKMDFSEWNFAYMSFIDEPDLIWRWWIWK